jgi:DNA-binding CsgD family transcriptional regulator
MQAQRTRFVGRRDELVAVDAALDGLRSGRARWLVVAGEPGIGKTRLLGELAERAAARRYPVFVGRGAELERELPFAIWIDALDDHVASLGERKLEALIGERVAELARVLPSAAPAAAGGLHDERFYAYRAVRALLQRMAMGQPLVLMLDDVHWADDASLELIAHLLRRPPPAAVLIALAFRAGQVPNSLLAALEAAGRDGMVTEVALGPLSQAEAEALLGRAPQPLLYSQSGGNPFYLEELSRAPRPANGRDTDDADAVGVPPAVAAALGQEIRGLSERAQRLGWGAAVAGEPFELDLAAAAAGLSEPEALSAIDDLLAANVAGPTDVARRYRFRHPLVRRAVYDGAGEAWRLQAHARAAAALADRPGAIAARAHHVERSARVGDEDAAGVLEQAGHQAAAQAPAVAARWFEAALRLLDAPAGEEARPTGPAPSLATPAVNPTRRLALLVPLAASLAATGRLERALGALVEALTLVDLPDLRVRLISACAACENLLGRHDAAHARLRGALEALEDQDGAAAAALHAELAADALYDSDFEAMRDWASRAAEAARRLSDRGLEALATALLCFAEYNLGNPEAAEAARLHAATLIDALPDDQLMMRLDAPYYFGFAEYFCEHYEDSIRHFRRGINLSRAIGQGQFVVPMMVGLAHALEIRGRLAEAAETADAAVESARLAGNRQQVGFALVADAWTAASLGDGDRARAAGDEAVALLDELDDSVLTRGTHAHLGVMWADLGEYDRCLAAFRAVGMPEFPSIERGRRGWMYAALARTDLARGDRGAAQAWADRAEQALEGLGLPFADAWLLHARAAIALDAGDADAAVRLAFEAMERGEAVEAPLTAARCRTLAGAALAAAGRREDGVRELARAESELSALGAARHRDEAARELRRLGERVTGRQRRGGGEGLDALSGREREIAELVAEGRTNREIGAELFLSEKTIEGHLTRIFAKLGVTSRVEVAEVVGRTRAAL